MQTPRISVIVPIYNVEKFLPACVNSLLAQTFSDFELILVDDGSPDGCPALCDRFALQDARIHVIHRANGGLSAARNSGIEVARGETIAFVDSDDLVHPEYLEQLYTALMDSGADLAVCGVEDVNEDGTSFPSPERTLPSKEGTFSGRELMHEFFDHNATYYTVAWNKLYKRSLWDKLRYPEGLVHEDDAVAHLLYWNCATVVCLKTPLYFYRLRQGSICRNGIRPGNFDSVHAHAEWCRFFRDNHLDQSLLSPALAGCFRRYLSLCAQAKQALTWSIAARWNTTQAELRALLPLALSCPLLTQREKLSIRRWCTCRLPMPPKTEKKRIGLLLPPGLPVPAVKGGAVEGLVTHLVAQNQKLCQLELVVFCEESEQAAKAAAVFSQTMFVYISKPSSMQVLGHRIFYKVSHLLGGSRYWNFYQHQVCSSLKSMDLDFAVSEGGSLDSWSEASHILGADKLIAHLHGVSHSSPQLDQMYHSALAISNYVRQAWLSTSSHDETSVSLLPNCIDTSIFNAQPASETERQDLRASLGFTPQDFVVIFCGRICEDKGIHRLVDAVCSIADPHVKLLVIGSPFFANESDSPFFTDLRAKAASLGERIQFTGFLPNEQLPAYYRSADLACFPALWDEPAGITAIEAMACGCPIIATNSGGMPEYLAGSDAVLLERDEIRDTECIKVPGIEPLAEQLQRTILELKSDPDHCHAMSLAGTKRAADFSQTAYYTTFVDCLHAL